MKTTFLLFNSCSFPLSLAIRGRDCRFWADSSGSGLATTCGDCTSGVVASIIVAGTVSFRLIFKGMLIFDEVAMGWALSSFVKDVVGIDEALVVDEADVGAEALSSGVKDVVGIDGALVVGSMGGAGFSNLTL